MSYKVVRNGLSEIIRKEEYVESKSVEDFAGVSPRGLNKKFIIKSVTGELDEETQETLCDRFYDNQIWELHFAVSKSEYNDTVNRDMLLIDKDTLIKKIDDPASWRSYVRMQKYFSWEVIEEQSYFLLIIKVNIQDVITY